MKKILLGIALLISMSSFASNCQVVAGLGPWHKDYQGLTAQPLEILREKGYEIVVSPTEQSKYLVMNFNCRHGVYDEGLDTAYCTELEATVDIRDNLTSNPSGPFYAGISNPFLLFEASADVALEKALDQIPDCI